MNERPALLLYSGGIDSVQALYARCMAGLPTRTHHVVLKNRERRHSKESKAVDLTMARIRALFPRVPIVHTTSTFDFGDLKYLTRDHIIWGTVAGIILADPKNEDITQVVRTFHRDSVVGGIESEDGRRAEAAWRHCEFVAQREVEFLYPQINMTKQEIMEAMPKDLLRLTWYCRRPRLDKVCHTCHTCRNVDAVLAGDEWIPLDERTPALTAI